MSGYIGKSFIDDTDEGVRRDTKTSETIVTIG